MFYTRDRLILKKNKGFLMTEAVLSLFVLTVGLISVLALISSSLKRSFENRDTIIAVELAQEGVELVRNVRDNGFLETPPDPFGDFDTSKNHCRIDYNPTKLQCQSNFNNNIYSLRYKNDFYEHGGATEKFFRYIYINYTSGNETAEVKSFVYWGTVPESMNTGSTVNCTVAKKCVFTEIFLTNWRAL